MGSPLFSLSLGFRTFFSREIYHRRNVRSYSWNRGTFDLHYLSSRVYNGISVALNLKPRGGIMFVLMLLLSLAIQPFAVQKLFHRSGNCER